MNRAAAMILKNIGFFPQEPEPVWATEEGFHCFPVRIPRFREVL